MMAIEVTRFLCLNQLKQQHLFFSLGLCLTWGFYKILDAVSCTHGSYYHFNKFILYDINSVLLSRKSHLSLCVFQNDLHLVARLLLDKNLWGIEEVNRERRTQRQKLVFFAVRNLIYSALSKFCSYIYMFFHLKRGKDFVTITKLMTSLIVVVFNNCSAF